MAFLAGVGAALGKVAIAAGKGVAKGATVAAKTVGKGALAAGEAIGEAGTAVGEGVVEAAQAVPETVGSWFDGANPGQYVKSFSEAPANTGGDFASEFMGKFKPTYNMRGEALNAPTDGGGALQSLGQRFGVMDEAGNIDKRQLLEKGLSMMQSGHQGGSGYSAAPPPTIQHAEVQPGAGGLGALPVDPSFFTGGQISEEELARLRRRFGGF